MIRKLINILLPTWSLLMLVVLVACKGPQASSTISQRQSDSTTVLIVEKVRKDTVKVPGETVVITQRVECPPPNPPEGGSAGTRKDSVVNVAKSGRVLLTTTIVNGVLTTTCTADSLELIIEAKDKEITILRSLAIENNEATTLVRVVTKYRIPWWLYALAIGYLVWKFRNPVIDYGGKAIRTVLKLWT